MRATAGQYAPNPQGYTRITMSRTMRSNPERGSGPRNLLAVGIEVWNRPREHGAPSIRVSSKRGEYVPAFCTHRPSLQRSEVRLRLGRYGSIETGPRDDAKVVRKSVATLISINKVSVGEPADGSPPTFWKPSGFPQPFLLFSSVAFSSRGSCILWRFFLFLTENRLF